MANLPESATYTAGIIQLETTDLVLAGPGAIMNQQATELGNRTAFLKTKVDALLAAGLFPNGITDVEVDTGGATLSGSPANGRLYRISDDAGGPYSGEVTITLPTSPTSGDTIGIWTDPTDFSMQIVLATGSGVIYRADRPWGTSYKLGTGAAVLRYDGTNWLVLSANTQDSVQPVGAMIFHSMPTAPAGWLVADGSQVAKATYPLLWALIGTTYGAATATEFTLPDFSGSSAPFDLGAWVIKY